MITLSDYQLLWDKALLQNRVKETASALKIEETKLELYQSFVQKHYLSVLKKMFPRLSEVYPKPPWKKWAKQYYELYPPQAWELNYLTENFPSYLRTLFEQKKIEEYYVELSQYEWFEFAIYLHSFSEDMALSKLSENQTILNQALCILSLNYDISSWVCALDRNEKIKKPESKKNILLISRNPKSLRCCFTNASPIALLAIEVLKKGAALNKEILAWEIEHELKKFNLVNTPLDPLVILSEIDFLAGQGVFLIKK